MAKIAINVKKMLYIQHMKYLENFQIVILFYNYHSIYSAYLQKYETIFNDQQNMENYCKYF